MAFGDLVRGGAASIQCSDGSISAVGFASRFDRNSTVPSCRKDHARAVHFLSTLPSL